MAVNINMRKITEIDLKNKCVMIREDFNVPMENQKILHDVRLQAALPTIQYALSQGAKIILLSHLDRPEEGIFTPAFSLEPVSKRLSELLKLKVIFKKDTINNLSKNALQPGEVMLCENVRFNIGEKNNDDSLAQKMAQLCDVFVMDAFASAHRAEASTTGIAKFAPIACAGLLLIKELEALQQALAYPRLPLAAVIGGSKVSTKLILLEKLLEKINDLILGGGIANTFLAAQGMDIGKSLYEQDLIPEALKLIALTKKHNVNLHLPVDVKTAKTFSAEAKARLTDIHTIYPDEMILDIGPETALNYSKCLISAGTIIWNGPVGVFEFPAFEEGTRKIADAIAQSSAFSLAGGGDTLSAIDHFNIASHISYRSTGGGAFLEFIEGKKLPAIDILEKRAFT